MSSNDAMIVKQLFEKATNSVLPHVRLKQMLQFDGKNLVKVQGVNRDFIIPNEGCHIIGFGKAVIGMAAELQRILKPENIRKMILSVPYGISDQLKTSGQEIQLPIPQPGRNKYFTYLHYCDCRTFLHFLHHWTTFNRYL